MLIYVGNVARLVMKARLTLNRSGQADDVIGTGHILPIPMDDRPKVPVLPTFRRRINKDGKWDSICLRCFMTIRPPFGVEGAGDLVKAELLHVCERAPTIRRLN